MGTSWFNLNAPVFLSYGYRQIAKDPKTGAINTDGLAGQLPGHVNGYPPALKRLVPIHGIWLSRAHGAFQGIAASAAAVSLVDGIDAGAVQHVLPGPVAYFKRSHCRRPPQGVIVPTAGYVSGSISSPPGEQYFQR